MAFDPSKKNNNFQSMPSYANPYSPPPVQPKKGSGAGVKAAMFAVVAIVLVAVGVGVAFYLNALKINSQAPSNVDGQSSNNNSVIEIEIFN